MVARLRERYARFAGPAHSVAVVVAASTLLQACSLGSGSNFRSIVKSDPRPVTGSYKLGRPYVINGVRYVPRHNPNYDVVGNASWYGRDFHGRRTSNGEIYNMNALTAAHPTLPMPSHVRVTNLRNGRSLVLRVNDRGPFVHGRVIDLSYSAAVRLGMASSGVAPVRVQYVGPAPL